VKVQNIKLKKEDMEILTNTPNILSKIGRYEVPRGHSLVIRNDDYAYLKITAKEVVTATISSDPFEITVSHTPAPLDVPDQQGYAVANGNIYKIVGIDVQNKKLQISGPTTASDVEITVYYAVGEGSYQLAIERPVGDSVMRETVATGSLYDLNSRNLYDRASGIVLPELLLRSEWELLLLVNTPANIDLSNDKAVIEMPATILDEEATLHVLSLLYEGGV